MRRPFTRTALALVTLGALLTETACIREPARLSAPCGIAVDGSGSGNQKNGFAAEQEVQRTVVTFLRDKGCRRISFAPIGTASEGHRCTHGVVDVDPDAGGTVDREKLRDQRRVAVRGQAAKLLECIRKDTVSGRGSDVLGGLKVLAKNRPAGDGTYHLLVISDFIVSGPEGSLGRKDLSTPAKRTAVIRDYANDQGLPDLSGAEITTAGYGKLFSADAARMDDFDAFWNELLITEAKCVAVRPFDKGDQ
ncbi:hypothetical protein ACPXB5_20750 [Micromonospora arida]|uniref:hypothetical protein n=1 Tax=Micromonospora arida TaxID=2203715 RepID=UPI003CF25E42